MKISGKIHHITMCIVHKGFRGFRAVSASSILGGNLIGLKSAIPYSTIHSPLPCMMKAITFIIPLIFTFISCNQSVQNKVNDVPEDYVKYLANRDSIIEKCEYGSVYYTKDTNSIIYNWIIPDTNDIKQSYLTDYIEHIKDSFNIELSHFDYNELDKSWCSLFMFNNEYCLYAPSDWMANIGTIISDSVYYISRSDATPEIILDYKNISDNTHQIKVINYFGKIRFIKIEIIDTHIGIAIWSIFDENENFIGSSLKVVSDNVKQFPFLVYDCEGSKCVFKEEKNHFEKPNFELLKKHAR
tara:strand:+ start:2449 stop:3345 length:897 start_codon:yes stop_codon:yes gene_type:complete